MVHNARRFIMYYKVVIESFPLQVYISALLFSPRRSLVKKLYTNKEPKFIKVMAPIGDQWSACLQTLEGHGGPVESVAFSPENSEVLKLRYSHSISIRVMRVRYRRYNGDVLQCHRKETLYKTRGNATTIA